MAVIETFPRERSLSYPVYKVYRRRFYVLFVFAFLAFNQCLFMLTFSPIYESTKEHYDISDSVVDLLLAWGPIFFVICLPLAYILLNRRNGLRYCVLVMATLELAATLIRIIPSIIMTVSHKNEASASHENGTSTSYKNGTSIALPFLHIGQILNAACGPLAMAPVSQLSSLWFNTNERTRATTVAIMAFNVGSTSGFLLGPAVAHTPDRVPNLLYVHVGFALCACILAFIYFPGQPPTPPSPAAELLMLRPGGEKDAKSWRSHLTILWQCFTTRSFVLLVIAGGLIGGTYAAWISLFDAILGPEGYSEKQTGWFGFTTSTAEIIGGLIFAYMADMPRFNRSFKVLILVSFIFYFLSLVWFNLSIHTVFYKKSPLPSKPITIAFSIAIAGFFQGAASPLTYESLAEIMYPLPESLSASILVEFINVTSLILILIAPKGPEIVNLCILIIIAVCIILVSITRFIYKRRDADRTKRITLVAVDDEPVHDLTAMNNTLSLPKSDSTTDAIQMDSIPDYSFTNPMMNISDA